MKKIHITLVGKEALPVFYPIYEDKPDLTYLIGTKDNKTIMRNISNTLIDEGLKCYQRITEPFDPSNSKTICNEIISENGNDCEYTFNVTGGTKTMAFGAILSAFEHNGKLIYTDSNDCIDLRTNERKALQQRLSPKLIFSLQGQKLKSYSTYVPDDKRTECAKEVQRVFDSHKKDVLDLLKDVYDENKCTMPSPYKRGDVSYKKEGKYTCIHYGKMEIFRSDYEDADKLLFEGRWWETLVADAIYDWADGKYDVWTSVVFNPQKERTTKDGIPVVKNEIDILVNLGNKFLFIECKSNKFDQNAIYKLNSIAQSYGSDKSKSIIIAYRAESKSKKILPDLREKATESKVEIIVFSTDFTNLSKELTRIINTKKA